MLNPIAFALFTAWAIGLTGEGRAKLQPFAGGHSKPRCDIRTHNAYARSFQHRLRIPRFQFTAVRKASIAPDVLDRVSLKTQGARENFQNLPSSG